VHADPPAAAEIAELRERVREALAELDPPPATRAFAVGGTAISLLRLVDSPVDAGSFERTVEAVVALPREKAGEHFAIHPDRVRLLPAGLLILGGVAGRLGLELTIAGGGLREGAVLALAEEKL
jgi:exopolyphosphatase/guanosine-5'-triphosphate,3'-diphosphate pyrophosphatase